MFRKVLVANRGEIALRIIRACHAVGAKAVAVYSEADADSPHLKEADETICIGGGPPSDSYLRQDILLEAARITECQAIHPGFGFLAENATFAVRCRDQKLTFVGPSPHAMRVMGDKVTARTTMAAAGLPVMPGSKDVLPSIEVARQRAKEIGYPVLLKATSGGGGRGMRRVNASDELETAWNEATREADGAFGDARLYLEKFIVGGRHIEFQILADHYGNVVHLGERECSVQRNHQKLLEEAPATRFDPAVRNELGEKIRDAVRKIGYFNAGTIEFLMDVHGKLYFMEMNTRIQVEHPVTEMITGVDLVAWQLRIAAGERLTLRQEDIQMNGHAIEVRINVEDPTQNFRPSPGTLEIFDPPELGEHLRLDTHVEQGYRIPPFYDSMIGKLIAWGEDREAALKRMQQALADFEIGPVQTTIPLHQRILSEPDFAEGSYDCTFLPNHPQILDSLTKNEEG